MPDIVQVIAEETRVVQIIVPGPQGPQGPQGEPGDAGSGGGVTDGDKGDVIVSGAGSVWQLDPVPATARINPATTSLQGALSASDKTKLDSVASGATANSSDATLLARANHTGTQTASTISDFATAADARAAAAIATHEAAGDPHPQYALESALGTLASQNGTFSGSHSGNSSGTNTGDETAAGLLAKLLTVDGAGSGLDADTLDGQSSAAFASASHTHTASQVTDFDVAVAANSAVAANTAQVTDFDVAVAANSAVAANTAKVTNANHTGDATGATALTLATVNSTVGSFGLAASVAQITVNAKGLITAAANVAIAIAAAAITDATTAGKAMLTAATAAAQRVLLSIDNLDNTSDANKPVSTAQQTALNLKANSASPAFTGTPTSPTAAPGTNTTQIATTAFVTAAITADAKAVMASVDFGSSFSQKAQLVVTGQTWVNSAKPITCQVLTPAGSDPDEMFMLNIHPMISDVINGVGFTVSLYSQAEARGTYTAMCTGQ